MAAVSYEANQERPFQGHDFLSVSSNKGISWNFSTRLKFMTQFLKHYPNSATDFRGTSVAIQNEPTKDMATVAKRRNKVQIPKFVSVTLDETSRIQ
jgi:hypothetical protein